MPIWYHTTHRSRLQAILTEGLRPYSPPLFFASPAPYIMLSVEPWIDLHGADSVVLRVRSSALPVGGDDPEGLRWPREISPECLEVINVGHD